jgi:hypothetical protein
MTTRRRYWTFDRADRLSELAARTRLLAVYLYRERCDVPHTDSTARAALDARIALNERRFRILSDCGRAVRRSDKGV